MKKLGICLLIMLVFVTTFASVTNASDNIVESPDVKIIIDGKIGSYNDVPIILNGRTMLPLREVLTNLGVSNDDEHIIWDPVKRSVTVKKDDKSIYLEVGKKAAYVNNEDITIDVAPIIYPKNNRTYIPARFVAESLGKKVIWDGSSRAVLIRDESKFNEISDILTKSNTAMELLQKCKFDMAMSIEAAQEGINMNLGVDMKGEVDTENNVMYMDVGMNMFGMDFNYQSYFKDNVVYTNNPMTGTWEKETMADAQFEELFESSNTVEAMEVTDVLCAGLVIAESENPDEILLKGDVYVSELLDQLKDSTTSSNANSDMDMNLDKYNLEMSIDKNSYLVNSIVMEVSGGLKDVEGGGQMSMNVDINYTEHDGEFEIVVPQEVIEGAVEAEG